MSLEGAFGVKVNRGPASCVREVGPPFSPEGSRMKLKAVTLLSGGLDSTTLAYSLKAEGYDLVTVSFIYGQRHQKELEAAAQVAQNLETEHHDIHLMTSYVNPDSEWVNWGDLGELFHTSLTGQIEVPDGHYAAENMKQTVVPNRNAMMLSIAYAIALAKKADLVTFAAHAGDHAIYPDCRPEFVKALSEAFQVGARWTPGEEVPRVVGPFLNMTKAEIVETAARLMTPEEIGRTWSCYKGGDIHCGTCGTCYERREAFKLAEVEDPTKYKDNVTEFAAPVS
jgi:7-cyano-7-deazaguanine synthase